MMRLGKLVIGALLLSLPVTAHAQRQPTATPLPPATVPPVQAQAAQMPMSGDEIELGDTVTNELGGETQVVNYTFEGESGDTVIITLTSDIFDPYLQLLGADEEILASDDDSAGDLDSRIGPFSLPDDGTYTIVVQSYPYFTGGSEVEGEYTLSLQTFEARRIEYTQTVEGELTETATERYYSFSGQEGDAVIVRMESDDFDSYLTLLGTDGSQLTTNDDGAGNLNAQIGPYLLPQTGSYLISARSLSNSDTGSFTLTLERAELTAIEYGDTIEATLDEDNSLAFFAFEGTQNDVINITVESEDNVDTRLQLIDPFNFSLITDENSGGGDNPEISEFILTQSGAHTISLELVEGEGEVTLTLEREEAPSLNEGAQIVSFSNERSVRVLSFTGEANTTYRLSLELTEGEIASPSVEIRQGEFSTVYVNATNVRSVSAEFTLSTDEQALITINEYSYTDLTFRVLIEELSE